MTIGNVVEDSRINFQQWHIIYPQGWYFNDSIVPVGLQYSRVWSGADRPKVKIPYERFTLYRRDTGKFLTFKRRADVQTRLPFTDHNYSLQLDVSRSGTYTVTSIGWLGNVEGISASQVVPAYHVEAASEWSSNDTIAAIGKLRERIAGSDFNMGVFLAEGHEALSMILNSARVITKYYSFLAKGDIVGAMHALGVAKTARGKGGGREVTVFHPAGARSELLTVLNKPKVISKTTHSTTFGDVRPIVVDLAGAHLAVQYGWMPLVKDASGAAEFLAKSLEFPMIQSYRVKRKKPLIVSTDIGSSTWPHAQSGMTVYQIIARLSEVDPYKLVGLTDPASVLWEKTPWSFVADWFIPIGQYLAARGLASSLTGTFVTTLTRRLESSYTPTTWSVQGVRTYSVSDASTVSVRSVQVTRTVSTSLSVPLPTFKQLSAVASWRHCANAVALLTQSFAGRK